MWVLFVLSMVERENKVTFYNDYDSLDKCQISARSLTSDFSEGEKTICFYAEYLMEKVEL